MAFCPKCKGLMMPRSGTLTCMKCGHVMQGSESKKITHEATGRERVIITEEVQKRQEIRSTTQQQCPKCFHMRAYAELRQTRSADEPATRFLECVKCGHRWREYA